MYLLYYLLLLCTRKEANAFAFKRSDIYFAKCMSNKGCFVFGNVYRLMLTTAHDVRHSILLQFSFFPMAQSCQVIRVKPLWR